MISTDATRIVQALVLAEKRDEEAREREIPRGPVVALSRMYGAGGAQRRQDARRAARGSLL